MADLDQLEKYETPCLIVAHPDDEIISSSQLIRRLGARINLVFATGTDARQEEAKEALAHIDILSIERLHFLGIEESRIYEAIRKFRRKLAELLKSISPDIVITHAFEGGHFDHDVVRFIVEKICLELQITLAQFAFYFYRDGVYHHNVFIDPRPDDISLVPTEADIATKREMLSAYRSQQPYLRFFDPSNAERVRICGDDERNLSRFLSRPHAGAIGYDHGIDTTKTWDLFQKIISMHL